MKTKELYKKILKLGERGQYGFTMTKPLPNGCIKKEEVSNRRKFDLLLETVILEDKMRKFFVVEIHFYHKNETPRQFLYNEIFPPVIEKHKIIDASERSVYQLIEQYSETDKGIPYAYRCTHKAHATLFEKSLNYYISSILNS